ncbi:MAG: phosphoribosylanthranilate isomerase [Caulobacteraceae bacterium]|nr:phosphoribosylanthranilate isomerase [Caulobacter sp.]
MAKAKICGLSTPGAVAAAVAGGAGWVGFVTFPKSPRHIAPEAAAALAGPARAARVEVVSVLVDPDDALLDAVAHRLRPDWVQLHGAESPARAAAIRMRTGARVIKALPVSEAGDLAAAAAYAGAADALMFDAKPPPDADRPGGVGARFDWAILKDAPAARGAFLAGGLDPWNVGEALAASGVERVDVSSGVERGAGVKDPALITAFLQAVRRA